MATDNDRILALDIGLARIGMALASRSTRLASPAGTLSHDDTTVQQLRDLCQRENVTQLVIGLPRGLNGQDTQQTASVHAYGEDLAHQLALSVHWQDEAVTSVRAEEELKTRGKPYRKEDIDALAATYILEDYLS